MKKVDLKENIAEKSVPAKNVDDYLSTIPEEARSALENLRKIIKAAAPKADEIISYRIPTFVYYGPLVGFHATKNHCSFHLMSPSVMNRHKDELKPFDTTTATIHFSPDKPLPVSLVKKLVQARIEENEARHNHRKKEKP
jgi:uncharacterized protein YdhG (YjbR/CyaY superfamily)